MSIYDTIPIYKKAELIHGISSQNSAYFRERTNNAKIVH